MLSLIAKLWSQVSLEILNMNLSWTCNNYVTLFHQIHKTSTKYDLVMVICQWKGLFRMVIIRIFNMIQIRQNYLYCSKSWILYYYCIEPVMYILLSMNMNYGVPLFGLDGYQPVMWKRLLSLVVHPSRRSPWWLPKHYASFSVFQKIRLANLLLVDSFVSIHFFLHKKYRIPLRLNIDSQSLQISKKI